jgi:drug/metabolite transporter (DMT)-like permease
VSAVLLAAVCSAGGFTLMAALVAEVGPVRTTTVTYLNPAVAIIAGAVVLGEPVTGWAVAGFALILAGCYLVATRRTSRARGGQRDLAGAGTEAEVEVEPAPSLAAAGRAPATSDCLP